MESSETAALFDDLHALCSEPTVSGDIRALEEGVTTVVDILRRNGLTCQLYATPGAPIVIGRYDAGAEQTVLLYGRYDVPSPGKRRDWKTDPFRPAIRGGRFCARGAIVKGELVARATAVGAMIEGGKLPFNVCFVVEGESVAGSPHLQLVRRVAAEAGLAVWSGGSFDASGRPLFFTGVKGLLQVELRAHGGRVPIPMTYAATAPNPLWSLASAIGSIKSSYEEITIDGFYDDVAPPDSDAMAAVKGLDIGEEARRSAWGVEHFLANLTSSMLARADFFTPSCSVSLIEAKGNPPSIPTQAVARIDFLLVPDQRPERVYEQLVAHLEARGLGAVEVVQRPGAYLPRGPVRGNLGDAAVSASTAVFGAANQPIPLAPFAAPAGLLLSPGTPLVSFGLERPDAAVFGIDESVAVEDLQDHARLVQQLILAAAV